MYTHPKLERADQSHQKKKKKLNIDTSWKGGKKGWLEL